MKIKLKASTILLIIGSLIGLSLLLYPYFSDFWNRNLATHVIETYVSDMENLDESIYKAVWDEATAYNRSLLERTDSFHLLPQQEEAYPDVLHVGDSNIIGFIDIPKIGITLPIYHGVSDEVLQVAVGHVPWSSLPTGGVGTHCVLSGHRGLQSAKLFTDLDLLREGDCFMIRVLNEVLTYEVDQIRVVEPMDASYLTIDPTQDYCTLVTCTPYGINTHRLLVRGHRTTNVIHVNVISEAVLIDRVLVGLVIASVIVFLLILKVMLQKPKAKPIRFADLSGEADHLDSTEGKERFHEQ